MSIVSTRFNMIIAARFGLYASFGFAQDMLFDQGRDDVRRFGVEVVAGAVEVDGQEEDGIEPVLLVVPSASSGQAPKNSAGWARFAPMPPTRAAR